jgi:hypothetical protein
MDGCSDSYPFKSKQHVPAKHKNQHEVGHKSAKGRVQRDDELLLGGTKLGVDAELVEEVESGEGNHYVLVGLV